ncbi:MAG: hypothetical protein ACREJN_16205 [Nitrospiraceae bacterium]
MEYEFKAKVDPNRSEKVFTASQIVEAFSRAEKELHEGLHKEDAPASMCLVSKTLSLMLLIKLEMALGIDGPEGAYVDGKATERRHT